MKTLDIIWNISLVCPWDCDFCCTDAVHVSKVNKKIIYKENNLSDIFEIYNQSDFENFFFDNYQRIPDQYDQALYARQMRGLEPTLSEKIQILYNLKGYDVNIDFAGGDPLACFENFLVVKKAAEIFGKENISITSTGLINKKYNLEEVANYIGEYEFTYDEPEYNNICRPKGYNNVNLEVAAKFSNLGIKTKAQLPIHVSNIGLESIENIISNLNDNSIDELLLMRTFPVGRAYGNKVELDSNVLRNTIEKYLMLAENTRLNVRIQCALKHLYEKDLKENPCDLMRESFGINFQGKLLVSAWANDKNGLPIHDDFVLGNLSTEKMSIIEKSKKFIRYKNNLDSNFGHCKIFSYLFNNKKENGLFTKTDPLYSNN